MFHPIERLNSWRVTLNMLLPPLSPSSPTPLNCLQYAFWHLSSCYWITDVAAVPPAVLDVFERLPARVGRVLAPGALSCSSAGWLPPLPCTVALPGSLLLSSVCSAPCFRDAVSSSSLLSFLVSEGHILQSFPEKLSMMMSFWKLAHLHISLFLHSYLAHRLAGYRSPARDNFTLEFQGHFSNL